MKLFFCFLTAFLLTCSLAKADWSQTFRSTYGEKGVDTAVVTALGEGIAPVQIMQYGLIIEGLDYTELIKALFCALVMPATINEAAEVNQVPESTVSEGYQRALTQCAEEMEEQENIAPQTAFPGASPAGQGRPAQASPWNFK